VAPVQRTHTQGEGQVEGRLVGQVEVLDGREREGEQAG
jgi:hypothetical protein